MNTLTTQQEGAGFYVAQFKNSDLSSFSYYVESQKEAYIIDPTYNTKSYQEFLTKRGATLKYVLLTHYHSDFISGHLEFKVPLLMGPGSKNKMNSYEITQLKDGEKFSIGTIKTAVLHTPGHTPQGTSYVLYNSEEKNTCVFTGNTLFVGYVGRPLTAEGLTKTDLSKMLFQSIQKLKTLPDDVRIYPAHGSGPVYASQKIEEGNFTTVGEQKAKNFWVKIQGRNQFIANILQNIPKPPCYYPNASRTNKIGPNQNQTEVKKANNPLNVEQFSNLAKTCTIFDTRASITESGIIKYSYWIPQGAPFIFWIPIVANPKDDIILIVQEGKSQQIVQRFISIGYLNVKGYNNFKVVDYPGEKVNLKVLTAQQVLQLKQRNHVDVRNLDEWKKTGIIEGSYPISQKQIKERAYELKGLTNIVINCRSAMRARFCMSVLAAEGIQSVVLGEKVEDFEKLGFNMLPYVEKKAEQ